jgi:hypothetical protein
LKGKGLLAGGQLHRPLEHLGLLIQVPDLNVQGCPTACFT